MALYDPEDLLRQHGKATRSELKCTLRNGFNEEIEKIEQVRLRNIRNFFPSSAVQKLKSYNFAQFIARVYSHASIERASLIFDIIVWIWIVDDLFDRTEIGKDKLKSEKLRRLVLKLIRNEPTAWDKDHKDLVRFSKPIFKSFQEQATSSMYLRFVYLYQQYIEAMDWEVEHRVNNTFPTVESYKYMRRFTGALYPSYLLNEFAIEKDLPIEIREHEAIKRLEVLTADMICWANDIFSLKNELQFGEIYNIVILTYLNEKLPTLQEALDKAIQLHNTHEIEINNIMDNLPDFGSEKNNSTAHEYIDCLLKWVRGNYEWSLRCGRYNVSAS